MPAVYIDTLDGWRRLRPTLEPVYITSKTHGRILVPCANTVLVRVDLVLENLYNPNSVSPDKMALLQESILDNGFCFPVVAIWDDEQERFVVVDGAHRRQSVGPEWLDCDYVPVVVLAHTIERRLTATWQFNKARGVHQVDLDAELIRKLIEQGVQETEIATKLGVDLDTIHRYKQITGVAELFRNTPYSMAWEIAEVEDT